MTTNPALKNLGFLAGEWTIELSNASFLPDPEATVRGRVWFEWLAEGAALMMRQGDAPPSPPAATWIFGRDEAERGFTVLYNDARGVSRVYHMSFGDSTWKMWRADPGFSQRFEGKLSQDSKKISAHWEKSMDGGKTWQHDFDVSYLR